MIESAQILMDNARELDKLSRHLLKVEQDLADLEIEISEWEEATHTSLWEKHMDDGEKLPAEAIRLALAHQTFDREKYRRYLTLKAQRARGKARISDLREIVAAHRSLVSAAKTELEASEGPQPQWTPAAG